jgi:4-hydroxybenzoate polyprenyltransferase
MTLEHGIILLKKCRPVNLLSIILLQCFTYFFLFYNILSSVDISLRLSLFDLFLITLDLALIMGAGYLINDIFDIETDRRHQNKESLLETGIPLTFFRNAYWAISILGLIITLYLAQKYQEWGLSLLYPAGVFILYLYAKKLKNSILWGNIVIAILCCFPSLMLYLAEAPSIQLLKNTSENLYAVFLSILYFYLLFSFISTLIREIIKDLEDKDADLASGIITFANKFPSSFVINICSICIVIFLGVQIYFCFYLFEQEFYLAVLFFIIWIIPITLYSFVTLRKAQTTLDFKKLSLNYKIIILSGIIQLAFIQ